MKDRPSSASIKLSVSASTKTLVFGKTPPSPARVEPQLALAYQSLS